jgi:signal transduction histidine kinase
MAEGRFLWVGTIDSELPVTRLDTENGRTVAFPSAGKSAYAFCRDTRGRLWIGGQDGFVVGRDSADGKFEVEISMPTKQVCRIICASDGAVWVASINGSIIRYKSSDYSTHRIPISNILTDIIEDGKGRILATSEGTGLWEYKRETDSFQSLGLTDTRLLKISRDGDLLWITGSHGIQILNPDDPRPLPLITTEILGIDSFNYSSNFISGDGTLYAGTSDGFISFSVSALREASSVIRKPAISSFRILSSSGNTEGGRFLRPGSMLLGSKTRSFEVSVSLLDYALFPGANIFWKIDGLGEWTQVENGRFTVYDIPSGRWKLRLKSVSLSGGESEETILDLRVKPPLLLSPMAILMYIVLFLMTAFGIALIVERKAKAKAEMEQERKILESKMDFLTSIAHEIRTPLSLVQIPLEELIRKFSSSPDGSVQENLDIMRRNSMKLTVLINELLDFRKLTDSTYQIHPEFLDIRTVLKDAHRRFLPMFVQEGKTLSIQMREAPVYCETDVRSLGRIFDNLLSNALKYSSHHTVITLSVSGSEAVVSVENDGTIIPEDVREEIFKPFYRYDDAASAGVEGTGLGLSTSRQFASLLGGSLSMDDDIWVSTVSFSPSRSPQRKVRAAACLSWSPRTSP